MAKLLEKISWVLADSVVLDPTQDIEELKRLGAFWGSWRTWRACQTDNVICHDQIKANELIQREFQKSCNLYIPESVNASLYRPVGVKVYAGEFVHDVIHQEEIVAMHLAATTSDIVIMLGWNLTELTPGSNRLHNNQLQHHRSLVRQAILNYNQVQWVIVDHTGTVDPDLTDLDNVVTDTLDSVLTLI
jgi:hypothetical protein